MLVEFYTKSYKKIVEVVAWLMLVLGVIAGGVIGSATRGGAVPGIILGFLIAAVAEALFIPPLMILFQINDKLEKLSSSEKKEASQENETKAENA